MLHSVARVVKFGWENIFRNFWLSFITVSTIVVTLFIVSIVMALQVGLRQIIEATEKRIDLAVFFYPIITDSQTADIITMVKSIPGVESVTLVSKEQSLADYEKQANDSPELTAPLEVIGYNPFGSSIIIRASETTTYQRVIDELNKPQYKDFIEGQKKDFEENQQFINSFLSFANKIKISGYVMIGVFAIIAGILIFNAIRIAVYTHRDEIAIMKLVGATNWFVRAPFLMETFIYSVLSVAISGALFLALLYFLQPYTTAYFGGDVAIYGYFSNNLLVIFSEQLLAITVLNIVAGSLALRRYLRV